MMMIVPNSLACQKEGGRGRGMKGWEAKQELQRQARTFLKVFFGQGCWMRGTGENMAGGKGFYSTGRAEGARGSSLT